jgi:hypothetical protein
VEAPSARSRSSPTDGEEPPGLPDGERCRNCDATMTGPVCAQYGQRRALPIAVRPLLGEIEEQLVGLDFRLARTVRYLGYFVATMWVMAVIVTGAY